MPYEETSSSYHPWDRGMLVVGAIVVGMALWGVLASPDRPRRRPFLAAGAIVLFGALFFAAHRVVRGIGAWRDLGWKYTPKDLADAAIPALEFSAIGCLGVLGLAAGAELAAAAAKDRVRALAGATLLAFPFLPSLLVPTARPTNGFLPVPPLPESAELFGACLLWGMLGLGVACLFALARMARGEGDPERSARARRFGLRAGLAALGLAVVAVQFLTIHVLMMRALLGPKLTTTLWSDLQRTVAGNWVVLASLLLGTAATAMAGARREGGAEPAP